MATSVIVRVAQPVLLDTCTAIWLMGRVPISEQSRKAIQVARVTRSGVFVSAFSAWEIGMLVSKGKVRLTKTPEEWFNQLLAKPGIRLTSLTPRILINSTTLPGNPPNDPADRIVVATAREYGYSVITRDREILAYADQGHIMAIES